MTRRPVLLPGIASKIAAVIAVAAAAVAVITLPAQAATPTIVDWGTQGATSTASAVTVRWDNSGNAAGSVVARDKSQVLPLTGGKTYADVDPTISSTDQRYFSGLMMTVGQTADLLHQAVTLSFTGIPAWNTPGSTYQDAYVEVFQCWGAPKADGTPDPNATSPDPRTCQEGPGGTDLPAGAVAPFRDLSGDPLAQSGSLSSSPVMPVLAIDGTVTDGNSSDSVFTKTTTNELSSVTAAADGTATRRFEVQTGVEASWLGCGARPDAVSTGRCWLVAVPHSRSVESAEGFHNGLPWMSGLTPSLWAQRMQVPLDFAPAAQTCSGSQGRVLASGSELATLAMSAWIPGLCAGQKIATGYSQLSDAQARAAQAAGSSPFVVTSQASTTDAVYAPLALTGVVIAFNLDYNTGAPYCRAKDGVPAWQRCNYPDEATWQTEVNRQGQPITSVRLNARLVAKLLTQSYGLDNSGGFVQAPHDLISQSGKLWDYLAASHNGSTLTANLINDPEFQALNPDLIRQNTTQIKQLEVETLNSDAAAALWRWIVADPQATAFLDGCPDRWGMVVNPWYSTRSYAECTGQASALAATAAAERATTTVPPGFDRDATVDYAHLSSGYPKVLYTQTEKYNNGQDTIPSGTMVDVFPGLADQSAAALQVSKGFTVRGAWCSPNNASFTCTVGQWKPQTQGTAYGQASIAAVTDAASAARYQLTTASLCSDDGTACVGASTGTLQKQAARYTLPGPTKPAAAPDTPDYADGAYPLTILASASVATANLSTTDAHTYAAILGALTTTGQTPGTGSGQLLPGYAPLPAAMIAAAANAVTTLNAWVPVTARTGTGSATTSSGATSAFTPSSTVPAATLPQAATAAQQLTAANPVGGTITESAAGQAGTTPATGTGAGGWAVPASAGGTAFAAAASALLLRRRRAL